MATTRPSCPACAAVADGGRVRFNEDTAVVTEEALRSYRGQVLFSRRMAIDDGDNPAFHDAKLDNIDRVLEEIARTQSEKGWRTRHVEPQRSHP